MYRKEQGTKHDSEKPRWDLLPMDATEEVVKVLTFGAQKYSDDNWQVVVSESPHRYVAAAFRHFKSWICGERNDPESGLNHLAHCACCILFLLWKDIK